MLHQTESSIKLRESLLGLSLVRDCEVMARANMKGKIELVAYVVPAGNAHPIQLRSLLTERYSVDFPSSTFVFVSALPQTADGNRDYSALCQIPVLDDALVRQWQQSSQRIEGASSIRIELRESNTPKRRLHVSELIPATAYENHRVRDGYAKSADSHVLASTRSAQKIALSIGDSLDVTQLPTNLQECLAIAAARGGTITYVGPREEWTCQSYGELLEEAQRIATSLSSRADLKPQDPIVLQCDENKDILRAFWGCILGGFVPVPLATAPFYRKGQSAAEKLHNVCSMLHGPLVIAAGCVPGEIKAWEKDDNLTKFRVADLEHLMSTKSTSDWYPSQPEHPAIILFTSGSTGKPKGVVQRHSSILARSAAAAQVFQAHFSETSLNWFPLDHVGGIVMFHLQDVFVGCNQVHATTGLVLEEPLRWLDLVDRFRITRTWAPNFAFGLINDRAQETHNRHWDLSSVRVVINGGEAVVAKTARRFLELLAPFGLSMSTMRPSWGMSETCSGVTIATGIEPDRDDAPFVEVGAPIPGVSIRIVSGQDELLHEGEIGKLQILGPSVTTGYYENDAVNEEAFSADGWFNTGDLAFLREGRLTITGRSKDVIIIRGANFYCHEIEAIVEDVPGVASSFTAAVGVRNTGSDTDKLCIFFHCIKEMWSELLSVIVQIREAVLNRMGILAEFLVPVDKDEIPKTSIGKIQRSQLKESFESGEFSARLKQMEIDTAGANTIPDWFSTKMWIAKNAETAPNEWSCHKCLIFSNSGGLGSKVRDLLPSGNTSWIEVEPGQEFRRIGVSRYQINPACRDDYQSLIKSLVIEDQIPETIIHLWGHGQDGRTFQSASDLADAQSMGCYSLLFLAQSLANSPASEHRIQLFVVTSNAQVIRKEDVLRLDRATVMGLLRSIAAEAAWLDCRHIDLEPDAALERAHCLVHELTSIRHEPEVAYRGGYRLVSSITRLDFTTEPMGDVPLKRNGIYLLAGGLGGIGTEIAALLAKRYGAKLIIVGRTPLPPRSEWYSDSILPPEMAAKIRQLLQIESYGSECIYRAVDISNFESLRQIVEEAEALWDGKLTGIFQMTGSGLLRDHWSSLDEHGISKESITEFERNFEGKVYGTWNLFRLVEKCPDALLVFFSSVNGLFGGATFAAYSAANSFLDAFSAYCRNTSHPLTYNFNWTMWDNLGMSAGTPEYGRTASKTMGYSILSKQESLYSLLAGLCRSPRQVAVGLDLSNPNIRKHIESDTYPLEALVASYQHSEVLAAYGLPDIKDRFGTSVACIMCGEESLDEQSICELTENSDYDPQGQIEQQLAGIWRDILQVPHIRRNDRFFHVGGDSLLAMRLINQISKYFGVRLPIRVLFDQPTIELMAQAISSARVEEVTQMSVDVSEEDLAHHIENLSDEEVEALLSKVAI